MPRKTAKIVGEKLGASHRPDPRFAAFARLLARDLAQKHFKKELKTTKACGYDSDAPPEDTS